jgi:hypothetical protein
VATSSNRPSFEKVDYTVRPAKNIERKMIGEMLGRLRVFRAVEDYVYVGLGSTFFSDFVLFHKMLGLRKMISIEKETTRRRRITFNKPFRCISVAFGETTDVLPSLNWNRAAIVWLDYDNAIDARKLDDLVYLSHNVASSSVVIVTLPARPDDFPAGRPPKLERRLRLIREAVNGRVPDSLRPTDTSDLHESLRRIADTAIREALAMRNAARPNSKKMEYRQIMNFRYSDGTPMLTFGGIFLNQPDTHRFELAKLSELPFYKSQDRPYLLKPPKLTFKERRRLDEQLPGAYAKSPDVPQEDVREYAQLYRYFPWFVEAEL